MIKIIYGIFIVLHGLVHMFYFAHSLRLFELRPGLTWPDGSWAFARLAGDETTRILAAIFCALAAVVFVIGGIGGLAGADWWRPLITGAAVVSIMVTILFWDGKMQHLDDKGFIGLLINLAILAALFIWHWPHFH